MARSLTQTEVKQKKLDEARQALVAARNTGRAPINLWYVGKEFQQLTKKVLIGGIDTELVEYDGALFRAYSTDRDGWVTCIGTPTALTVELLTRE